MFNVIICGIVKNAANYLQNNLKMAIELGKQCDKYAIVIYENNSTDNTKKILHTCIDNKNFYIISEDLDEKIIKQNSKVWANTKVTGSHHPCRIEQIANARNKLINELQNEKYDDYNYVVMIDFDSKMFSVEGILSSLRLIKENPKRVIYANSEKYYDYYALRSGYSYHSLFGPELLGEHFWKMIYNKPLKIDSTSTTLVPVFSAFNGIGVYDKAVFSKFFYDILPTTDVKDIYKKIVKSYSAAYTKFKPIIQSPCKIYSGGERDELFYWKNNSGYDKPLICEHVAFNFALLNNGYEIYINPRMLYSWSG